MSWREILGATNSVDDLYAQNTHNTQKGLKPANSADIAGSAYEDSKLLEALASASHEVPINPIEVRDALAHEDIEDWRRGDIGADTLVAFARALVQRRTMEQGKVPAHYTERATCQRCGPIWLWVAADVLGCPWCWNRIAGRPIPRPR